MNIHYTVVINKKKENHRVQMGQKFKKLLKEEKKRRQKETTHSLRQYYFSKGPWVETLIYDKMSQ